VCSSYRVNGYCAKAKTGRSPSKIIFINFSKIIQPRVRHLNRNLPICTYHSYILGGTYPLVPSTVYGSTPSASYKLTVVLVLNGVRAFYYSITRTGYSYCKNWYEPAYPWSTLLSKKLSRTTSTLQPKLITMATRITRGKERYTTLYQDCNHF
jgi:hypothetical protein